MLRLLCLLLVVVAAAMYFGLGGLSLPSTVTQLLEIAPPTAEAPPVYRWKDAQGRIHYGNEPPVGVRAEIASGGTVNTLSLPTPAKPPGAAASAPVAEPTLQQMATERAIEQATR